MESNGLIRSVELTNMRPPNTFGGRSTVVRASPIAIRRAERGEFNPGSIRADLLRLRLHASIRLIALARFLAGTCLRHSSSTRRRRVIAKIARGLLTADDRFDLVTGQGFELKQTFGDGKPLVTVVRENAASFLIGFVNQAA